MKDSEHSDSKDDSEESSNQIDTTLEPKIAVFVKSPPYQRDAKPRVSPNNNNNNPKRSNLMSNSMQMGKTQTKDQFQEVNQAVNNERKKIDQQIEKLQTFSNLNPPSEMTF